MLILAHRGYWKMEHEKNTVHGLTVAVERGYGIETDIRDYTGKLVISHNIADENCPDLEQLFSQYVQNRSREWLALNVKADGIQQKLEDLLSKYNIKNYFLFDMSVPEMVVNKKRGLNYFTRHSDIESECVLYKSALGVWLDSFFDNDWIKTETVSRHLNEGKLVCMISPEIHGFDPIPLWERLKKRDFLHNDHLMLCTDLPDAAKEYFGL